ncbi:GntR family transcriptional regulator [Thalassotalea loyana]|uniref:GntR family transcriptional regulator n=1 Tax=Thalassotalea loyana TaxID=280483 RepID=A0ABQ6HBQ2_9GAMM|nr:GntR family transcriptional regulator [Thalassotalea loyana]GLX84800.1 GntR family transcriptional regulator [Thalassotalea loyana]
MAIVHKTRTQLVVEVLRNKILSGEIAAGESLRQAALAEELNVSRIPVREALLQLEAEGLVNFEPHKGATATELSADQVDEIFELRALLECELLKYSIDDLTDEDIAEAEALIQQMEEATGHLDNAQGELNYRFHNILYCRANRPHTAELADALIKNSLRYVRMHLLLAGGESTAQDEHKELLRLCAEKQSEQAQAYLREHIISAKDDIKQLLRDNDL